MKLNLRHIGDAEERELRERAEARSAVQTQRTSYSAGEHSLHQEFSRVSIEGQPVFHLRAQGPRAAALNGELAGLEFLACHNWYHPASETVAVERYSAELAAPVVSLIELEGTRVSDIAVNHRILWRSLANGSMVVTGESGFSSMDNQGERTSLVSGYSKGHMIEDMLVVFNEDQPRVEMSLVDPILCRVEDALSPEALGTLLGVDLSRGISMRFLHRSDQELCFDLLAWEAGRCTSMLKFALGISSIALGTIDD